jgi:hypothetical protein
MGAQWEFVVSQPNGLDAQSKQTVRKAAMRAFRRNQRQERMQQFKKQQAASSPESDEGSKRKHPKVAKVETPEADYGVKAFPLPARSPERLHDEAGLAITHTGTPLSLVKDRKEEAEACPEPSPTAQLSDGLDLAVGFPSPTSLGSNCYELLRHCTYPYTFFALEWFFVSVSQGTWTSTSYPNVEARAPLEMPMLSDSKKRQLSLGEMTIR